MIEPMEGYKWLLCMPVAVGEVGAVAGHHIVVAGVVPVVAVGMVLRRMVYL